MIKEVEADIFDYRPSFIEDGKEYFGGSGTVDYIIHQANLFCTFGSGIAAEIKRRYPYAYEADCKTAKGDYKKLGAYEIVHDCKLMKPSIINAYSQDGISAVHRTTNYAAVGKIFFDLEKQLREEHFPGDSPTTLGIPYKIGCGLAGGDWNVVRAIVYSAFEKSSIHAVICRKP